MLCGLFPGTAVSLRYVVTPPVAMGSVHQVNCLLAENGRRSRDKYMCVYSWKSRAGKVVFKMDFERAEVHCKASKLFLDVLPICLKDDWPHRATI